LRVVFGLEWTARGRATKDASELVVVWGVLKKGLDTGVLADASPRG
jgi:hypothetical protein